MQIKSMAQELGALIKDSDTYSEYASYAAKMRQKPELIKSMNELKHMQMTIAISQKENVHDLENEKKLSRLYSDIAMDEDAIGLWNSERELLSLLSETLEAVSRQVPMDLLEDIQKN